MIDIPRLDAADPDFDRRLEALLAGLEQPAEEFVQQVREILHAVRQRGDAALLEFTNRFDRRTAGSADLVVPAAEIAAARDGLPAPVRAALETAAARIRSYHERQRGESWNYRDADGTLLGQQVTPLDRVGVYVPGGQAAYPSSVLMNVIPAQVAGVKEIVLVVPAPDGELNPVVLAAAGITGIERLFTIGGAQAVAALAYGTATVPPVDKIVGPGNRWVAEAKRQVFGQVGIDMIAGPSEILIVSDGGGDPDWVAMDLFAQAEHDEDARAMLVCTDAGFIERVAVSIGRLLPELERAAIIRRSLQQNGALIRVPDLARAAGIANRIAPEHLELAVADPQALLGRIRHAGAVFLGCHTPEALGDYCAGPNHVLPTARSARFSSPLGVYDFQKRSSLIMCDAHSAAALADTAATLARAEGLTAHARSAALRGRKEDSPGSGSNSG